VSNLIDQLPLARFEVDRAANLRTDPNWLEGIWNSESTRVLVLKSGNLPVTDDLSLILVKPDHLNLTAEQASKYVSLLGISESKTYLAYFTNEDDLTEASWVSLRNVGSQLTSFDVGLATSATALGAWHNNHQFCAKCGAKTLVTGAGWSRTCSVEKTEHYPRTEPAMIVAVEDEAGRILLGRRKEWAPGWFSTLAGFVEAGESVEACVVREVFEESGIKVDRQSLRYLGSQPWPFPASLMLGYRATALTTNLKNDDDEMAEVRWFSRDEFTQACENKTLQLPNTTTIAWHLIGHWYGQQMPTTWCR
jgi:NAD+ diphosphatase